MIMHPKKPSIHKKHGIHIHQKCNFLSLTRYNPMKGLYRMLYPSNNYTNKAQYLWLLYYSQKAVTFYSHTHYVISYYSGTNKLEEKNKEENRTLVLSLFAISIFFSSLIIIPQSSLGTTWSSREPLWYKLAVGLVHPSIVTYQLTNYS